MYSLFNITAYEYVTTQRVTQQNELAYNGKYFIVHHCFLSKPKIQRKSITALYWDVIIICRYTYCTSNSVVLYLIYL